MTRALAFEKLVRGAFALVRASHLLETGVGRQIYITAYFQYKRYLEDSYTSLLRRRPELFQDGDILDIGANVGYTAAVFARGLSNGFKVYAFEPEPLNFGLLKTTITQRELGERVVPVQAAVGSSDGALDLWINPAHPADHRIRTAEFAGQIGSAQTVRVPVVSIDSFVRERAIRSISFIKIDVQGFEPEVCTGMERTLAENPAAAVGLEYMPDAMTTLGFEPAALLEWFESRGYQASAVGEGTTGARLVGLGPGEYTDLLFEKAR